MPLPDHLRPLTTRLGERYDIILNAAIGFNNAMRGREITLAQACDLAALPAPDDTNDRFDIDIADQTWSAVAAGTAWTDLLVCYDPDTTGGTDSAIIPLTCHDFAVTPDGSDITAQIAAAGFFRAS